MHCFNWIWGVLCQCFRKINRFFNSAFVVAIGALTCADWGWLTLTGAIFKSARFCYTDGCKSVLSHLHCSRKKWLKLRTDYSLSWCLGLNLLTIVNYFFPTRKIVYLPRLSPTNHTKGCRIFAELILPQANWILRSQRFRRILYPGASTQAKVTYMLELDRCFT